MKINTDIDLTTIITLLTFVGSLLIWGISLERKVSANSATVASFEKSTDKVQAIRWEENSRRLEHLRRDITILEEQLREK